MGGEGGRMYDLNRIRFEIGACFMRASTLENRPRTISELIDAPTLASFDAIDVRSRKMFAGRMPGERRSKRRGNSVEFDDYRNYTLGDDLRHVDWNVLARLDRLFVKLFQEERDLSVHIAIDCSASMDAGNPNKLLFAHRLALAIGYIGLVHNNRVRICCFGKPGVKGAGGGKRGMGGVGGVGGVTMLPALRGRAAVHRLAAFLLESLQPIPESAHSGPMAFADVCKTLALSRSGTGVMIVLSDFFFREDLSRGLNYLAGGVGGTGAGGVGGMGGFDTWCLQVLAPEELDPSQAVGGGAGGGDGLLSGDVQLIDAETGHSAQVTMNAGAIARYREKLEAHLQGLDRLCLARSMTHRVVLSDRAIDRLILGDLRRAGLVG